MVKYYMRTSKSRVAIQRLRTVAYTVMTLVFFFMIASAVIPTFIVLKWFIPINE